jgi:uroporphyrin-III C-methyltransferase/precorrin-2 dehydrogenase/sirohydrochlorin ferrochelatase/uroporphyrin-III C-methyltransferase
MAATKTAAGVVYLVAAGPGNPELLTIKARRVLDDADVIVHDRSVATAILDTVSPDIDLVATDDPPLNDAAVNELLAAHARDNRTAVLLKGGDAFSFGETTATALFLAAAGVKFEVVPGINQPAGWAALAGIPMTHRGDATSVRFVRLGDDAPEPDWRLLMDDDTTLALHGDLTGVATVVARLLAEGVRPQTPAAILREGDAGAVRTTLGELPDTLAAQPAAPPGAVLIGTVVAVATQLEPWIRPARSRHTASG